MNVKTLITSIIPMALVCVIVAGCGKKPYVLSVRDGRGVEKASHVFWDMGGTGGYKVVGDVTGVELSDNGKAPVIIKFELRKEFRETIRENVSGAVLRNQDVAQGAFVLLLGGVGADKEPLLRGVTIQEANQSASDAFFSWLKNELPEYARQIRENASQAFDQASEWASQKADALKKKAEEIKQDLSAPADE